MKKWAGFWALGLIWGSSFLLIRIGVAEVSPFQVVFMRTGIAAIGLNLLLLLRGKHVPFNLREFLPLAVLGLGNTVIPFVLISWGEIHVESGLASVLNATAALFTAMIAHFAFKDERITVQKIAGLILGFLGVVILLSRSWVSTESMTGSLTQQIDLVLRGLVEQITRGDLAGQLAIVLASFFYAWFGVYSRKTMQKHHYDPVVVSAGSMIMAGTVSGILMFLAPYFNGQAPVAPAAMSGGALSALLLLGLLNTFVAYIIFYWIIQQLGASRASMVTYVTPAIALVLGSLILNETIDGRLLVGASLILSGIGAVNLRIFSRRRPAEIPPSEVLASEEAG